MRLAVVFLAILLFLPACAGTSLDSGPSLADLGDRFSDAMRWKDFNGAGSHLWEESRSVFFEQFYEDDDLYIVDSKIAGIKLDVEAEAAVLDYRLEYYRLPSMRVKKWRWEQEWKQSLGEDQNSGLWLIQNAPPPFP